MYFREFLFFTSHFSFIVKLPHHFDDLCLSKNSQVFLTTKKLVDAFMKFIVDYRKEFFSSSQYYKPDDNYESVFKNSL